MSTSAYLIVAFLQSQQIIQSAASRDGSYHRGDCVCQWYGRVVLYISYVSHLTTLSFELCIYMPSPPTPSVCSCDVRDIGINQMGLPDGASALLLRPGTRCVWAPGYDRARPARHTHRRFGLRTTSTASLCPCPASFIFNSVFSFVPNTLFVCFSELCSFLTRRSASSPWTLRCLVSRTSTACVRFLSGSCDVHTGTLDPYSASSSLVLCYVGL